MSQAPRDNTDKESSKRYWYGWRAVNEMLHSGRSLSGNERNCCFLNLESQRFADVSAVTGLDHLDDGRAVALVDWDSDGDLDIWVTNRNAPSIRFLRNDLGQNGHFLALRLVGKTCNRDAIGARVEIYLGSDSQQKRIKSVRAGEGFLGQSSKWLHFGLGKQQVINKLVVHWPDGKREQFFGLKADTRYEIIQNSGKVDIWKSPRNKKIILTASEPSLPASSDRARIVQITGQRLELAGQTYRQSDGSELTLGSTSSRKPRLLILFASWCPTCVAELKELTSRKRQLLGKLDVLALSVDQIHELQVTESGKVDSFLKKMNFPFQYGFAKPQMLDELGNIEKRILNNRGDFSIPASFLLDRDNRVVVVYRGPVKAKQLLNDLELVDADQQQLLDNAVPFSGRWIFGNSKNKRYLKSRFHYLLLALLDHPIQLAIGFVVLIFLGGYLYFQLRRRRLKL